MKWNIVKVRYLDAENEEDAGRVAIIDLERGGREVTIRLVYASRAPRITARRAVEKYLERDELPSKATVSRDGRVYPD